MSLVLGNGSDEIIQMLMLAMARPGAIVLGVEPSFVMFRLIASFCGMRYVGVPLAPDFSLDERRMASAIEEHEPALTFIAYPNNPTGNLFDDAAIEQVLKRTPGAVVVDEAYHAFADRTWMNRLERFENLLVMRTLSKSGLAGLRLGVLAGRAAWLDHVDKIRLPYNVGVLTQLVADKALERHDLLAEQAATIKAERGRLFGALRQMRGATPWPSDANFILFRVGAADAVFGGLKQRGVLVKNLHGSQPALENCLRVTVGTPAENDRFLGALRESIA
jgi:histidinol-phosphate aminotransferase